MSLETSSLSFPTSPIVGQTVDFQGKSFSWNGVGWRQVIPPSVSALYEPKEQWIALNAAYTLLSQTGAQTMFPNGGVMLQGNRTYFFECLFSLTSMSGSSGSFGFAFGGTATLTRQKWQAFAQKSAALATAATAQNTDNIAANVTLATASLITTGESYITGVLRVGTGGTIIPEISLGVGAAAVVGQDSFFRIWAVGLDTQQSSDT